MELIISASGRYTEHTRLLGATMTPQLAKDPQDERLIEADPGRFAGV
jgi:hypothetical protein